MNQACQVVPFMCESFRLMLQTIFCHPLKSCAHTLLKSNSAVQMRLNTSNLTQFALRWVETSRDHS